MPKHDEDVDMDKAENDELDELPSDLDDPDDKAFHVGECLNVPMIKTYTTQALHASIHEGDIDLNPSYQRDVVWTEQKQIKLLDSIYRNYYVPPILFAEFRDKDGETVKRCVDGKQRLTSIQKFMDGQIPYCDPITKKKFFYTLPPSSKNAKLEVPEKWKMEFASKEITCIEYSELSHSMERDIFQRVQLGMPLTAAEKLQAISSEWAAWISDMDTMRVSCDDGIADKINVDIKRGRNFQSLAQMVYCCHGIPDQLIPTATKLEQWLSKADKPTPLFKKTINDVLTEFWHLANTRGLDRAFRKIDKRVAPIEFVFIGVVLYVMTDRSHEERAVEIYQMRLDIRKKFPDIRARGDIVKALWNIVVDIADRYDIDFGFERTGGAAPRRPRAKKRSRLEESDEEENNPKSRGTQSRPSQSSGKRKAVKQEEDESGFEKSSRKKGATSAKR